MSIADRYTAYMEAFEETFADDDWSRLDQYFTEDATYEADIEARGRAELFAKIRASVDSLDRKMDARVPDFDTPSADGDTVRVRWKVTYRKAGLPDLVISGLEIAVFEGDRIARLRDEFDPEAEKAMGAWMAAHGAALA